MIKTMHDTFLYHGSYCIVQQPSLLYNKVYNDFGQGFYTTSDRTQAIMFARRKAREYKQVNGYVNLYDFSNFDGLNVFEFKTTDAAWLHCIIGFRSERYVRFAMPYMKYDVLIGKVADDDTSSTINTYLAGRFGVVGSARAIEIAVSLLQPERLKNQICFKSSNALARIRYKRYEVH